MKIIKSEDEIEITLGSIMPGQLFKLEGNKHNVFMKLTNGIEYAAVEVQHGSVKYPEAFEGKTLIPIEGELHI